MVDPCPSCLGVAWASALTVGGYAVACRTCEMRGPRARTPDEAEKAWRRLTTKDGPLQTALVALETLQQEGHAHASLAVVTLLRGADGPIENERKRIASWLRRVVDPDEHVYDENEPAQRACGDLAHWAALEIEAGRATPKGTA